MKLSGSANQQMRHYLYRADGTITSGGNAQVVLGQSMARSLLYIENTSTGDLWLEIGTAFAHCAITSGAVTSVTVDNAGLGFSTAPNIRFLGGGNTVTLGGYGGLAQVNGAAPASVASAVCNMSGTAPNMTVSTISVISGGSGYVRAPYVQIVNDDLDPNGGAAPALNTGIVLPTKTSIRFDATVCPTDPVSLWSATTGSQFVVRYMD